ncbi:MAG: hypothetical protein Q9182_004827 [Xanthomendoza sp. 2 TL-2023]
MPVTGFELFGLIGFGKATADILDNTIQTLKNNHNSDDDIKELCFALKADSAPLRAFINILTNISTSAEGIDVSEEDAELHKDIALRLSSLEERLRERLTKLRSDPGGLASRSAWAYWRKKDLEKLVKELGDWIRRAWIDFPLKPLDGLKAEGEPSRRFAVTSGGLTPNQGTRLIFEYMYKPYSDNLTTDVVDLIGRATRDLACVLYHSNPEQTRILKSHGYCHDPRTRRFGLLYELPPSKIWIVTSAGHARITSSSSRTKWMKKMRTENEDVDGQSRRRFPFSLNNPYLAGFEYARSVKALSDGTSDAEWRVNIYRHPNATTSRWVLLEVCLWGSNGFVPFQKRETTFKDATPVKGKKDLLDIARGKKTDGVVVFLGERFADLVTFCLNVDEKQEVPTAAFIQEV